MKFSTRPAQGIKEISAEKIKLMTNSANGIQREIKVKGQKFGTVTSFKYLEAIVSDEGSKLSKDNSAGQNTRKKKKRLYRRRDGKIILRSGQGWTLLAQLWQLKTGLGGKGLL